MIQLEPEIYEWQGAPEILKENYFKINRTSSIYIKELSIDTKYKGVVLVGDVEVLVDTIIYTQSQGAFGDTIQFNGVNLVILGLKLEDIQSYINSASLSADEILKVDNEASKIIRKMKTRLGDDSTNISMETDSDPKYIIFGRKNFFLVSTANELVLIHKKRVSVRKKDSNLVQIDSDTGITIVDKDKCFNIGGPGTKLNHSILGDLGVKISSIVLDNLVWE